MLLLTESEVLQKDYIIRMVDREVTKKMIVSLHYSGKVVTNSALFLGVYRNDVLVGALDFGPPMNPKSTPNKIWSGSTQHEMFELNRMVMAEEEPRNSESKAIAGAIKFVVRYFPQKKYLLSFSDGKEGNVGYIYQASNWVYLGYNISSSFWSLDGTIIHNVQVYHKYVEGKNTSQRKAMFDAHNTVSQITAKQHVYVYPLVKEHPFVGKPYPKKEKEQRILKEVFLKKNGVILCPSGGQTKNIHPTCNADVVQGGLSL